VWRRQFTYRASDCWSFWQGGIFECVVIGWFWHGIRSPNYFCYGFVFMFFQQNWSSVLSEIGYFFGLYKTDFIFVIVLSPYKGRVFDKNKTRLQFCFCFVHCKERPNCRRGSYGTSKSEGVILFRYCFAKSSITAFFGTKNAIMNKQTRRLVFDVLQLWRFGQKPEFHYLLSFFGGQ
jgi:hypothetical protein